MAQTNSIQERVARKIQECLKELGFEAETEISEHEGVVFVMKDIDGKCVRIVAHITDREVKTATSGPASNEVARMRLSQSAIRPSLAANAAARSGPEGNKGQEGCE
jgi:hypothetical protein